jgi:CRP/FNR family cyclic AMP-dependent transcriptional regulator
MSEIEKMLTEHPFSKGLNPEFLGILGSYASDVHYDAGQMIYKEGEEANQFLLIRYGKVAIEIFAPGRGSRLIQTVRPGEVLGWSWLFPPYQRRFDARAIELTRALALDGRRLRFSKIVVERLQATRLQLLDVYGKDT